MATTTARPSDPLRAMRRLRDPLAFVSFFWPTVRLYDKQVEIIRSVEANRQTVVIAGNMLGKDFAAALAALWFFLTRHPCRVVTTSADYNQLESVLWGEVRRFIASSRVPLSAEHGGPLVINHLHLRRLVGGDMCPISYMIGRVAARGEGMLGHHARPVECCGQRVDQAIPRTLFLADEASGVDDLSWQRADTWAHRMLAIGNPYPCENFFREAARKGDIPAG